MLLPSELTLSHQAYAFGDSVVLLDARTFAFARALAFFEVFPALRGTSERIKCVSIEPSMKLVSLLSSCLHLLTNIKRSQHPWATD